MTTVQKVIKYLAIAFAVFLTVTIIGGILGAVGLFGGLLDSNAVTPDIKTYNVSSTITALDIDVGAADFTIKLADSLSVASNLKNLAVTEKDGTLIIEESTKFATYTDAILTLCIPAQTVFEKVDITTGAGKLIVDSLCANKLHLTLGAGDVHIGTLTAEAKAQIEGGAGKITVSQGSLRNLDLDMGVGQLNLTASLLGSSELDLGIGESNLTLIGSETDYAFDIENGIGKVTVNGEIVTDFGSSGSGENHVDINGGIGAINLKFKGED